MSRLKSLFAIIWFAVLTGVVVFPALAEIPEQLSFQGQRADNSGLPAADGRYSITFSIYDVFSGGAPLWSETHANLVVTKGVLNAKLPNKNVSNPFSHDLSTRKLFLGIKLGFDPEMTPRQLLTSSSLPGCARRADHPHHTYGAVIDKAMSPFDSSTDLVLVLVSLQ